MKEGIATRACGADGCFNWEAVSVAGLAFGKGVWTFISGNSGMRFHFMKEDVGLRVLDITRRILDVVLDMVTVSYRPIYNHLFITQCILNI